MEHARNWAANLFAGFVALVVMGFGLAGVVAAATIPIVNFSFEDPALADGDWTGGSHSGGATGWTVFGASGVYNPQPTELPQGPTNGFQVGWSANSGLAFTQDLGAVLTNNTLYTLQVDVQSRTDFPNISSILQLRTSTGFVLATSTLSGAPAGGFNSLQTTTYTAGPSDPNAGAILQIALFAGGQQSDWDNVRLDATATTAVPEPTTLLLWATTAAGLAAVRRRRVREHSFA